MDVRSVFEACLGDPTSRLPTRKGVSLPLYLLPLLLAALHEIEHDAIRAGDLLVERFENAGLAVPPALRAMA